MSLKSKYERKMKVYQRYKKRTPYLFILSIAIFLIGFYIINLEERTADYTPTSYMIGALVLGLSLMVFIYFLIGLFGIYLTKPMPIITCPNCNATYEEGTVERCYDCMTLLVDESPFTK